MQPRIQEVVKSVIAKYTAESLVESRDALSNQITDTLVKELGAYNIEVVSTSVENLDFSDAFTNSVEEKVVALQTKLKTQTEEEQKTMQKEEDAKRAEIQAKADASVKEIQAEADANVAKIKADADAAVKKVQADADAYAGEKQAEVNRKLAETITDELIKYLTAQQWDGKLPAVAGGDSSSMLIDISQIIAQMEETAGNNNTSQSAAQTPVQSVQNGQDTFADEEAAE